MASRSYNGWTPEQRSKGGRWYRRNRKNGTIPAPTACHCCGQTVGVNGHSEDYSEPFGDHIGEWHLCYRCHMATHCRFKNWQGFLAYKELIKTRTFEPTRDFRRFIRDLETGHKHARWIAREEPVETTFLDGLLDRHLTTDEAVSPRRPVAVTGTIEIKQADLFAI